MSEVLVSIDCITFNHEKYIGEALDSFLCQKTNFKYEILIHDDASTDKTPEIIRSYVEKYPDIIKPILQTENQYSKGVTRISYRLNGTRALGKYVAICEGDDYWTDPYKLQKQADYMESHLDCSMCFHAADMVSKSKKKIGMQRPYNSNSISTTEDIILGDGDFMATNSIFYRKEVMKNPPDLYFKWHVGDYPLQILTSTKDYAYYIDETMSVYRLGVEGSWSVRMAKEKNKKEISINNIIKTVDLLNEFNEYTNGRYSDAIEKKILENEFEKLIIEKNIKELKTSKYGTIYNSLSFTGKIKLYMKCYFYDTYEKMRYIKGSIKSR